MGPYTECSSVFSFANRGEIACRIIKTARKMGIETVAVYSDADKDALHVSMADTAVAIGPPPAAESYLVIEKIVEACKQSGAEAVHPGYGFLSERETFPALTAARRCVHWPERQGHRRHGRQDRVKEGRCCRQSLDGAGASRGDRSEAEAAKIAEQIGYPVIIKAGAGGGGKGMRVSHGEEVRRSVPARRSEALSWFGDGRVYVEKFIAGPRHIEFQVFGDKHGNVIHLGERECSVQRRNQKVIEEAPSPLLDASTRKKMGDQAVALAKAVGYDSAGIITVAPGQDKSFYFLEMNTRLQVEHPVTELITGIDLVEQMIRVARRRKALDCAGRRKIQRLGGRKPRLR